MKAHFKQIGVQLYERGRSLRTEKSVRGNRAFGLRLDLGAVSNRYLFASPNARMVPSLCGGGSSEPARNGETSQGFKPSNRRNSLSSPLAATASGVTR